MMRKSKETLRLLFVPLVLLMVGVLWVVLTSEAGATAKVIKVGGTPDLSGPTSETGRPFAQGIRDYFGYINKKGGIHGRKIVYLETDGQYSVPRETAGFKRFAMQGIVAYFGWSSGGYLQITKMAAKKKIVTVGGGIAEIFADVKERPYTFLHCASYDQVWRALVDYVIRKNQGKKLRVAIVYPDNGYGHQNANMCRKYLKKRGVQLVDEEIVGFKDIDATTQMLKMKKFQPDLVLCPQVEPSIAVIMRDAKKVGIDTKKVQFCVNLQGMGPTGVKLGGKNIEDLIGGSPFSSWWERDLPGIKIIRSLNIDKRLVLPWYMHGWTAAMVVSEGLRRIKEKEITGEALKEALETIRKFDTGGITSPISFSPSNHIGGRGVKLYKPNFQVGDFVPITGFIYPK